MLSLEKSSDERPLRPLGPTVAFRPTAVDLQRRAAGLRRRVATHPNAPPQRPRRRASPTARLSWQQSQRDDLIIALQQWADSLDLRQLELDAREHQLQLRERRLRQAEIKSTASTE